LAGSWSGWHDEQPKQGMQKMDRVGSAIETQPLDKFIRIHETQIRAHLSEMVGSVCHAPVPASMNCTPSGWGDNESTEAVDTAILDDDHRLPRHEPADGGDGRPSRLSPFPLGQGYRNDLIKKTTHKRTQSRTLPYVHPAQNAWPRVRHCFSFSQCRQSPVGFDLRRWVSINDYS